MPRLFALLALALASTVSAAGPAVMVERDIVYATADGEKVRLDLAKPTTPGPHPCVVCLHGGAWKFGDKKDLSRVGRNPDAIGTTEVVVTKHASLIEMLANQGYVAVSVGYRLAPKAKFPAQIEDAKTAVRFLRANAKQYDLDPDRIAALGFSAGGHLAALLGTTDKTVGFDGPLYPDQSSAVQCVVDFFGPTDLTLYTEAEGIEKAYLAPFLGTRYSTKPDVYKKASPLEHVSKAAPPFLILHGTADVIVPIIHSERLQKKLLDCGGTCELRTVPGEGHGWTGPVMLDTMTTVSKFLAANLKAK
ncbi:alpha/beta hydrolase [Limnoglobus roseus]|uniref:Alpha/beta hydrolase n=1 Tax=Limnoglobus roseus TaxID=2598579 RepID=A0A5C1A8W5_9BACT|nr:alpha/beta hydrolase [Limnoglobus roseus]QEL14232.1 alpha/beta hydrolase [Limnoglobus roseus]